MNRLDLGLFIYRTLGLTPWTGMPYFSDVPDPYKQMIDRVYYDGLVAGCGANLYCPNLLATRATLAAMTADAFLFLQHPSRLATVKAPPVTAESDGRLRER